MIRSPARDTRRPALGTALDLSHPIAGACGGFWSLASGGGAQVADLSPGANPLAFVGSPAWAATPQGSAVGSFTTTSYLKADAAANDLCVTPPFWLACLATIPSGNVNTQFLVDLGNTTTATSNQVAISVTSGTTPAYTLRDSGGGTGTVTATAGTWNDGLVHLYHARSTAKNAHAIHADGLLLKSGTTSLTGFPLACTQFSIGVQRNNSVASPAKGAILLVLGGPGYGPDPMDLYLNLHSAFASPWLRRWTPSVATGGPWPWHLDNALSGGLTPMGL